MSDTYQTNYASEAEWLEARRATIGASEVAAIAEIDEWRTPLQVYLHHTGELTNEMDQDRALVAHRMEPTIAALYADYTSNRVDRGSIWLIERNHRYPWLHSSPDAIVIDPDRVDPGRLELKLVGHHMRELWTAGPPLAYQAQLQAQLLVSGCRWGAIAALIGGQEFKWWQYGADPDVHQAIVELTHAFWKDIEARRPPSPMVRDHDTLRRLFPRHLPGKTIELGEQALYWTHEIQQSKARLKIETARLRGYENQLKQILGDAEAGELPDGLGRWTWKSHEVAEHMVRAHTSRVLRLTNYQGQEKSDE